MQNERDPNDVVPSEILFARVCIRLHASRCTLKFIMLVNVLHNLKIMAVLARKGNFTYKQLDNYSHVNS